MASFGEVLYKLFQLNAIYLIRPFLMNHFKCLVFILFLHSGLTLSAQDSTVSKKFSGIEASYDFGSFQTSYNRELFILKQMVSDVQVLNQIKPDYAAAYFHTSYNRINLELVYAANLRFFDKYFVKQEFKFGLGYLYSDGEKGSSTGYRYDSFDMSGIAYNKHISFKYFFHQEQIQCAYLLSSKVFKRHFKAYTGLGGIFGLSTWVGTSNLAIGKFEPKDSIPIYNSKRYTMGNFSASSFSVYIPFGVKYNLSCDINLFSDFKFGLCYTPKFESGTGIQRFYSFCLGARYKILNNEMDLEKNSGFW